METKRPKGRVLKPEGVGEVVLPLAVRTMTVDGKRMTPAFYKQITLQELIDEETGDLRGTPLGFFHLHAKECPDVPHQHLLWGTETQVHLAVIVSLQDDARYQKHAQASHQKQGQLISLLILALALADHASIVEWRGETTYRVRIGEYTFTTASDLAEQLEKLERARTQQKEDREKRDADEGASEGAQAAETVLAGLAAHGIEVAHPARSTITRSRDLYAYNEFSSRLRRWHAYPRAEQPVQLYWQTETHQGQAQEETLLSLVETNLASPHLVLALRSLLAERMLQEQRQKLRAMAKDLLDLAVLPLKRTKSGTSESKIASIDEVVPEHLWQWYQQESKRLKAYTEHWNQSVQECQTVEQLFLIS